MAGVGFAGFAVAVLVGDGAGVAGRWTWPVLLILVGVVGLIASRRQHEGVGPPGTLVRWPGRATSDCGPSRCGASASSPPPPPTSPVPATSPAPKRRPAAVGVLSQTPGRRRPSGQDRRRRPRRRPSRAAAGRRRGRRAGRARGPAGGAAPADLSRGPRFTAAAGPPPHHRPEGTSAPVRLSPELSLPAPRKGRGPSRRSPRSCRSCAGAPPWSLRSWPAPPSSSSTVPPAWASTCRAAPRSSWRPRTPPGRRSTATPSTRTLEVLRRRVDQLGVSEPSLQRSGDRRIIVELPGVADPEEAVAVIGKTAQLTFHPVLGPAGAGERHAARGETGPADESAALGWPGGGHRQRRGTARGHPRRRVLGGVAGAGRVPRRRARRGRSSPARPPAPRPATRPGAWPSSSTSEVISSPAGGTGDPLRPGHHRRHHRITGRLHRGRGQGPGPAHPGRRPARAGGDRRAADDRPHPGRRRHRGQREGGAHRRPADDRST